MNAAPTDAVTSSRQAPWWLAGFLVYGLVGVCWLTPLSFRLTVAVSERLFGGSIAEASVFEDVRAYHEYASRTLHGERPYRDFLVEYPIGAMPLFVVPGLSRGPLAPYRWTFAAEMWLCYGVVFSVIQRALERSAQPREVPGRVLWLGLALTLLGPVPFARFDAAPTLLALAGMLALQARQSRHAGVLWGIGSLVKVFPGVLWMACIGPLRFESKRWIGLAAFGLTVVAGGLAWWAIAGAGLLDTLRYHSGRGVEIASIWGNLLVVVSWLSGVAPVHVFDHHSAQVVAPGANWAKAAATIAPLVGLALVAWKARRDREIVPAHAAAAIWCLAVLGKVLSPQYLIWLLPFLSLIPGSRGKRLRAVALVATALTFVVYPLASVALVRFDGVAVGVLSLRNGLLLGLGFALIAGRGHSITAATDDRPSPLTPLSPRR